ncbi:hypothetical protein FBU31_000533 [Coemansia sp. 'formosensis']|nr:hypothetical protein FBU31_000533 [Coemansia sp. 'formosensis']
MNNFNHFEQGGALYITALRRIRELGAALHQAVSESSELRRTLANYENAEANRRYTEFALRLNVDERDRALFESRQTVAVQALFIGSLRDTNTALRTGASEHDRVVAGLQHTIAELQRTVTTLQNRDADHVRTIDGLQRTVAALQHRDTDHVRTINGLQRAVTDLQHANAGHVQTIDELERANADQQSQLNEAQCVGAICLGGINYLTNRFTESEYGTEIHRQSLDAAIPPPDILTDDDNSDVTDMVVDNPTAADTVATTPDTSLVVAPPVVDPLPLFDPTGTARHESLGKMYDQYGVEVTPERLLTVIDPFIIIDLDLLMVIYQSIYGCRLLSSGVSPLGFIQACTGRGTLRHWTPQLTVTNSARLININLLCRSELEFGTLRQNIRRRLGLKEDKETVVLGPILCYVLVTLCGIRMDMLTGQLLDLVFTSITGVKLQSLWVATEGGTNQMSEDDLCQMVKAWVEGLGEFITNDDDIEHLFDLARLCNGKYERGCAAEGYDSMGNVAAEMLERNEYFSQLFLGLQKADLEKVYTVLVHVFNSRTSQRTKDCLSEVSLELRHHPRAP